MQLYPSIWSKKKKGHWINRVLPSYIYIYIFSCNIVRLTPINLQSELSVK